MAPSRPLLGALGAFGGLLGGAVADSCIGGPCGPGTEECSADGFQQAPAFHLMDRSCNENDPNGPVFDPVHGMVHHFYQKHVAVPPGNGPVYGHMVSRDFVHWARLPVAIWNGIDVSTGKQTPYDTEAIFTGSATIVPGFAPDGQGDGIIQVYPGICHKEAWPACETGTLLGVAVPADYANDPLLTNWTKASYNPILENTERDPSTPTKTAHGEWRFVTYNKTEYGAASDADVKAGKWYPIGRVEGLPFGECPSVFPLPKATPGFEELYNRLQAEGKLPTHVFHYSDDGAHGPRRDWTMLGNYVTGPPRVPSTAGSAPGWEELWNEPQLLDAGAAAVYAAKDQLYPPPRSQPGAPWRRISWGWAVMPPASTQTLPREMSFNPLLRTLEWAPIEEQEQLRSKRLAKVGHLHLKGARDLRLPEGTGQQSEVSAVFELKGSSGRFGVRVMAAAGGAGGSLFYVDVSGAKEAKDWVEVEVGVQSQVQNSSQVMRLAKTEKKVSLRIFVDNTFSEAYFQNGRVTLTAETPATAAAAASLEATDSARVERADAWSVDSIWVSPEEVLRTPRIDRPVAVSV